MPGYDTAVVKCEPPSDEETFCPQLSHAFFDDKSSSGFSSIHAATPEVVALNDDVSSHLLQHLQVSGTLEELAPPAPAGPAATPVCVKQEPEDTPAHTLETLESTHNAKGSLLLERHLAMLGPGDSPDSADFTSLQAVKDEPTSEGEQLQLSGDEACESSGARAHSGWTQRDMDAALHALRSNNMSLTKASAAFGIPSTTLWQRARRLGIDTPKREGGARSWTDGDLRRALRALRAGAISANKASKAYGIPSSTLYKIARREGIRLAAPFNAAPVSWRRADLARALAAIRAGAASVQRAARQYGIPTGTLYGRCKREGIELSRSNPTPWSEDAMGEALEAVRIGQMSINQAAIHYNLPYSSLYGRFKRCKYQPSQIPQDMSQLPEALLPPDMSYYPPPGPPLDSDPPHTPHFGVESPDFVQEYPPMYYHQGFNSIATS